MNNFQQLEAKRLKDIPKPSLKARNNILQRMGMYHLISDFIELYLPRQFDYLIDLLNTGEEPPIDQEKSKTPNKQ